MSAGGDVPVPVPGGSAAAGSSQSGSTGAGRSLLLRRLPLIAFVVFGVMSVGAFFLTQKLKAANPVVWERNPGPRPAVFDPVGGRICTVKGLRVDYRRTSLSLSPTSTGRIAVFIYPLHGGAPVRTLSSGRFMRAVPFRKRKTRFHRFFWNGYESDGKLAPAGEYVFRFVLLNLDDHTVNLTGSPVKLITSAHPQQHGCFHGRPPSSHS